MNDRQKIIRKNLHRFIPAHFHDPFGLAMRLIQSKDAAAWFIMSTSFLALLATPFDLLLQILEKRFYVKAQKPKLPIILVTGSARSGTSVVAQTLIHYLPVVFFNNLTVVFQRSPITANILFRMQSRKKNLSFKSYYGKTFGFFAPNDGLHIWDRWLGETREYIPQSLDPKKSNNMIRFFAAFEAQFKKPLLNKNNNLNVCADLIADVLDNVYFICMTRNASFLSQSLLIARGDIHGNLKIPYGIPSPEEEITSSDYITDICRQVLFHEKIIQEQQQRLGKDRFWIISYEKIL